MQCKIEGCNNTAHCLIDEKPICAPCINSMAAMNSESEEWLRTALAVAKPLTGDGWTCEVCGCQWDSFHVFNGVCVDCRSVMPLAFVAN